MKTELITMFGLAASMIGCTRSAEFPAVTDADITGLVRMTEAANSALINGDIDGYLDLIEHDENYTLMAPFGGPPTHGFDTSSESRARMARVFRSGTFSQEVAAIYRSGDVVVLVTIERIRGEIGGLKEQDWSLRITQLFRRRGAKWRLVHRHADPLENGISLQQAAALARGDRHKTPNLKVAG